MKQDKTALILGASGGVGSMVAQALLAEGWQVRGMIRDLSKVQEALGIDWVQGDAMNAGDVRRAAEGASVIFHGVNPPGYRRWSQLVLPMLDNTIAAARAVGARVVLPGTIYNYDARRTPVVDENTPQQPRSRKGCIRKAMEARLRDAAPGVESLILRAGDYFGPGARSSWFSQAMVRPGKPLRWFVDPARGGGHTWAYLPDVARTIAALLARPEALKPFEVVQFAGHCDTDGQRMHRTLSQLAGRPLRRIPFPWGVMRALAPMGGFPREVAEIRSHWSYPQRLDNRRLVALLGQEPHTALDQALRRSLAEMGCPLA